MMEVWRRGHLVVTVIICILGCINSETDPNDASALRVMYTSLGSPEQLSQWNSNGGDPCVESWKGVTCSGSRVTEIKLSGLQLSGSLGYQLSSLTALTNLDLSNNNLAGGIPYGLPQNLTQLNLANNHFTGDIPYYFSQLTKLTYLNIAHNQLQTQLYDMFGKLSSLSTLDISFNQLPGNLPESFSNLSSINEMYLQNNQFTGTIDVLANLPLKNLNVANNHFTGWVPEQLKDIYLQMEGNNWNSGPAPPPPPGTPPAHRNPGHKSGGNNSPSDSGSKKSGIGELKSIQTPSTANTKTLNTPASINLRPPPIDRHKSFDEDDFLNKPVVVKKPVTAPTNVTSYSIADLQIATGSFTTDNLLGEGSFGRVYRAHFDNGKVLAVKKIDSSTLTNDMTEDFMELVSKICELNHPNVTELVGYCSEHGQHLLVYEFHKNGSLHDFLHLWDEYSKPLIWNSRVKIALGTARALEYLHEVCSPSIIHKNIKSSNILLGSELNPHLSDSGLASFLPNADQALNHDAGSGYGAPEVAMSGQYTLKSDVYSFGVVMLELLTGRKPFDSSRPRSEQSLVRWATPQLHDIDALSKMVDPALKGLYPVKSLSRFADVIALCVQPEPEFRPPMSEVVQALVRLVQRANMSKRTVGNDQGTPRQADNPEAPDYMS
ncbi:hypothetical protein GH714_036608 [Hevea brasiliensis]|uniref:Protein kinase domain-containing protein n=1 Tax=Hevea brasiliensis TaxID=3981 RepID=A0A6A6NEZ4_HEVBR|nr:hypothetical protein GH714_036608 [Hevea brasiliensis]